MQTFTVVVPGHLFHNQCWNELAAGVVWALRCLGYPAQRGVVATPGTRSVYLGWPTMDAEPDAIFYNTEQVGDDGGWHHNRLAELYRGRTVWDYSAVNAQRYAQYGLPVPPVVRPGYCPTLVGRIRPSDKTHDVAFVGSINERRELVLREIDRMGATVLRITGYGAERDRQIAKCRLCVNIHFYPALIFESVRCSYLAQNGVPVLSEESAGDEGAAYGMTGVPYEQIAAAAMQLVRDPVALEAMVAAQRLAISRVSVVEDIGKALAVRTEHQRRLNQEVTAAILEAEHAPTVDAWRKVLELEKLLSTEAETPLEREVAASGVISATQRIFELENL